MADWKQLLEEVLGPADASASVLDAEARQAAERILAEASASNETEALLHELDTHYPARGNGGTLIPSRAYLRGRSLLELNRDAEALESLLPSCEKLEQQGNWPDLAATADEILQQTASVEAARYLAKAAEQGGAEVIPEGSLTRALELFPDEHRLCWLVAEQLEREGDSERALGLYTGCLPALIEGKRLDRAEEIFVRLEEHEDTETVEIMLHACVKLTNQKQWNLADTYLEPLLPKIKKAGLAREAWDFFLKLLPKAPPESNLRRFMMDIAPDALPDVDGVLDLLARSGILDPKIKVETARKALDELFEFAPGYRVLHQSWLAGRVRTNEGDALIIDFAGRPGHRMTISLARRALKVIPADDLRVQMLEHPEEVKAMVREKPAEVAFLAIRELGGRVTTQELRRRLTGDVMPTSRWNTWWKDARRAMEEDERFDLSGSFRQTYAIRVRSTKDDEDMILPRLDRRRGIRANLNLLRRFLGQHPTHHQRALRMYTPVLTRWLRDEKTNPEAAMAICLLLRRWQRLDEEDLRRGLRAILTDGIEISVFADESDQRFMVEQALEIAKLGRPAILFALGSRYEAIRTLALDRIAADPARFEGLLTEMLNHPEERPHTAMTVIGMTISEEREKPAYLPSPWVAAVALCRLVERTGRDILRNQAMRLFKPTSALARALQTHPVSDEARGSLEDELKRWRESERFLFPILNFFHEMGLTEITAMVREERSAATNRFLRTSDGQGDKYTGIFVTRATRDRLEEERDRLAWELKNTIADAIRHAREHGDLSENAEYDAAKDKQAKHAQRIGAINEMLSKATMIEHVTVPPGEVGPGSLVTVRWQASDADAQETTQSFWLLGDGDSRFGRDVVSCSAPIGQALLGRKVGDPVVVELPDGTRRGEIVATEQRLPSAGTTAG
ncbi:MAG: GreA/GreB family elongation factor [Candidatus Eisenbacteria sp.]|nr:GreA/GreB family elongation factor [Candidatus Eisenbacteria bacterium]